MENIVSARRLRKSMLKDMDLKNVDLGGGISLDLDKHYRKYKGEEDSYSSFYDKSEESETGLHTPKFTWKAKMMIKCFLSLMIVFVCLLGKLVFPEQFLSNSYVQMLKTEYQKDYGKEEVLTNIEKFTSMAYHNFEYIIPGSLANTVKNTYFSTIKPKVMGFEVKECMNQYIFNKEKTVPTPVEETKPEVQEEAQENLDGVGGGEPIEEAPKTPEEASAVSMMQDDVGQIVNKNINMIKPISGVITSTYGARDQIFDGVNSYHTGTDIANNMGTEIHSATTGKVIKVQKMDKYYGNYVVVETNGVNFKYAHMSEIKVNLGDEIKQNDIVGLVGSTGMSTGPHLHFEISINGRTVDSQQLIKF